jgi:hypothetical protein
MTREEAHRIAYEDLDSMYHSTWIKVVVDDIYNDFESRTCENCKYLIGKDKHSKCTFGYLPDNLYEFEFGCIDFERRIKWDNTQKI